MELKIVRDGTFRPAVLGGMKGGNVHEDILVLGGRDTEIGWEDVFQGKCDVLVMRGGVYGELGLALSCLLILGDTVG
jgi:hypothetical protein